MFNRYAYANNNPYTFVDPDGRYVCNGSKSDCGTFDKALASAKDASTSPKLTASQRKTMAAAVKFLGEKGDSNVNVSFGNLNGEYANISVNRQGKGGVVFDLAAIAKRGGGDAGLRHGLAMRSLHEGDHGVRIVKDGHPESRAQRFDREVFGYRAEGYYQKATGYLQNSNNVWEPWNPGDGINEDRVSARANFSVEHSCAGSTEGSCQ